MGFGALGGRSALRNERPSFDEGKAFLGHAGEAARSATGGPLRADESRITRLLMHFFVACQ
jgi:hypothetical protein